MKSRVLFALFTVVAIPAVCLARDGSSSTGGGLPPVKQRFVCHASAGPISYRVNIPAHNVGHESPYFEAKLFKIENQVEDQIYSPANGVIERVQVFSDTIELEYETQDTGTFFKVTVFPEKRQTSGPNQGSYLSKLAFDLTGGQDVIKVFTAYCFPDVTPASSGLPTP